MAPRFPDAARTAARSERASAQRLGAAAAPAERAVAQKLAAATIQSTTAHDALARITAPGAKASRAACLLYTSDAADE